MQRLDWLKAVLAIDDTQQDVLLQLALDTMLQRILTYINFDALPAQLELVLIMITASYYLQSGLGDEGALPDNLTAITRGDVSMRFAASGAAGSNCLDFGGADGFFGWRSTLNAYRRLRGKGAAGV